MPTPTKPLPKARTKPAPTKPAPTKPAPPKAPASGGQATPDDQELASRLRVSVTRLARRLRQQSHGSLTPSQASVLGSVERLGTPTLGELAARERVQPPTVTRVVGALEAAGLVARRVDETDRRVSRVRLTAEGRRSLTRTRSAKDAFISRQLAGLDPSERPDLAALTTLLERLVEDR